ncbi:MAG: thiolase family protein [Acidobacteriia bacterium]|nr:thiolase family protein [Terriglobia bacterium]
MREVYIVAAKRTPIGKFGGVLKNLSAADLGSVVTRAVIERAGLDPSEIDEVIFGCARQAGSGPNVARQILWRAGLPEERIAFTVNMACASGLKSILLGAQEISLGNEDCIVAGGTESMSRLPFYLESARWGARLGTQALVDGMYRDGFLCPLSKMIMGETADLLAQEYHISREEQDAYALESQWKARQAILGGRFDSEIVPVDLTTKVERNGDHPKESRALDESVSRGGLESAPSLVTRDEHPRLDVSIRDLNNLPPVFSKSGTITAGNSSGITDGAAAVLLMSAAKAKQHHLEPLAHIVDWTSVGVDPRRMGIGPVPAVRQLLKKTGLRLEDFEVIELNEAFAAQVLACDRELHFDHQKLNVNGGAIALGHPIGATGARIVTTLVHEMEKRQAKRGLATLCVSGGLGVALVVERS